MTVDGSEDRVTIGRRPGGPLVWVTVRITALILAVLVIGHFAMTHIVTDVAATDASFVARRLSSALYVTWDAVMLVAAAVHGSIGVSVIIHEYAPERWRRGMSVAVAVLAVVVVVAGITILAVAM